MGLHTRPNRRPPWHVCGEPRPDVRDEDDIEVVGNAASCAAAVGLAVALQPSVAIVDSWLLDGDGITTATAIRSVSLVTRDLLLTEVSNSQLTAATLGAGCSGILTKDRSFRELVSAVHLAHLGDAYLSPEVFAALLPRLNRQYQGLGFDLTVREHELLQLMAGGGFRNKDLASQLDLSIHTVRNYVHSVLTAGCSLQAGSCRHRRSRRFVGPTWGKLMIGRISGLIGSYSAR